MFQAVEFALSYRRNIHWLMVLVLTCNAGCTSGGDDVKWMPERSMTPLPRFAPLSVSTVGMPMIVRLGLSSRLRATRRADRGGENVIATIPIDPLSVVSASEFIGRWTNAEWRAADAAAWRQTAGHAKNLDTVLFSGTIDMNLKRTKTLKDRACRWWHPYRRASRRDIQLGTKPMPGENIQDWSTTATAQRHCRQR